MIRKALTLFLFFLLSFGSDAQSQVYIDSIFSKNLDEYRKITVYLPDGYNESGISYPVIYAADGQLITDSYRRKMDSLIGNQLVNPFVLIGSHSNETWVKESGCELRNFDYVDGKQGGDFTLGTRFNKHQLFFTEELIAYTESKYRVYKEAKGRTFYGISNGADFGVSLAQNHPELISNFILFSVFNGTAKPFNWNKEEGMCFYFGYGLKEQSHVKKEAIRMKKYFRKNKISNTLVTWRGGHERKEWESAFVKALIRLEKNNSDRR